MSTKYRQAIDLEAHNNRDVCGIGFFVGDEDGRKIYKENWWIKTDMEEMDKRCLKDFWEKNPVPFKMLKEATKSRAEQMESFRKYYDAVPSSLCIEQKDMKLDGDNPEFDFGGLRIPMKEDCGRDSLRYTTQGEYRGICDYGDAIWNLGIYQEITEAADKVQKHDHVPANDAHHNVLFNIISEKVFEEIKRRYGSELQNIAQDIGLQVVQKLLHK